MYCVRPGLCCRADYSEDGEAEVGEILSGRCVLSIGKLDMRSSVKGEVVCVS